MVCTAKKFNSELSQLAECGLGTRLTFFFLEVWGVDSSLSAYYAVGNYFDYPLPLCIMSLKIFLRVLRMKCSVVVVLVSPRCGIERLEQFSSTQFVVIL